MLVADFSGHPMPTVPNMVKVTCLHLSGGSEMSVLFKILHKVLRPSCRPLAKPNAPIPRISWPGRRGLPGR